MTTYDKCAAALAARLHQLRPSAKWISGYALYVSAIETNLLPEIGSELYWDDYGAGAGQELKWTTSRGKRCPPKMHAAFSSAALVVNSLARWKSNIAQLILAGHCGFDSIRFEAKCPTGLNGTPPHLDLLGKLTDGRYVAVESKCIEFLRGHRTNFPSSYDSLNGCPASKTPYYSVIPALRRKPDLFRRLDAPQLIKHTLGLVTCCPAGPVTLLYLFWEPSNWQSFCEFEEHRTEVEQFAKMVSGGNVGFAALSYAELWGEWSALDQPA